MYSVHYTQYGAVRQGGVALVMAMVFLLILTIIGVTTMTTTALEERMAGNMQDKNVAFQAAESALVAGENWLGLQTAVPAGFDVPVTDDGLHKPSTTGTPIWESIDWKTDSDVVDYTELPGPGSTANPLTQPLEVVKTQPQYLIEDLGPVKDPFASLKLGAPSTSGRNLFRITARGTGGSDQAVAEVQSVFEQFF